ncbi:hypothetical protein ABH920_007742 [Catenulispora sp. EB89]|uniref:N,N-dimethylformamidase beta subunit family domain-containing protein n=1 Tax=Catenulispora sp. EB89 TaxID=3156257 RepID=UPI0035120587
MKTRRPARLPHPRHPLPGTRRAIQAYASAPSAPAGGTMEFRVSVPSAAACSVAVRRIGTAVPTPAVRFVGEDQDGAAVAWVRVAGVGAGGGFGGGQGSARDAAAAEAAGGGFDRERGSEGGGAWPAGDEFGGERGSARDAAAAEAAGGGFGGAPHSPGAPQAAAGVPGDVGIPLTWCDWEPSLLLDIPESWPPGLYVARFTVDAPLLSVVAMRGRSAYVPFVVRGPLAAGFPTLVVLPFAAYTAANPWPVADVRRARALSFDRPFAGNGLPGGFAADAAFVEPLTGTDFATSLDLHAGLVDPGAYRKVLLRADLWSLRMRAAIARAALSGTDVGGLEGVPPPSIDFAPGPDGRDNRILVHY